MTTVLVTGASGFIAKHIIRELLENNYQVKASVRSDKSQQQVEALFPDANISFVRLDLTKDDGWAQAMEGVDVLMHTASPFPETDPKDRMELIRPAVEGTQRALGAAQQAGVTRVILTSSCAAIYRDPSAQDMAQKTRKNWTDPDGDRTSAYEASKTLAEKAAWDFVAAHPEMRLTSINPGAVYGPAMDVHYGTSMRSIKMIMNNELPAIPKINLPVVDVRDVALMHVKAIDIEETVGQRFPANAGSMYLSDTAQVLKDAYPDRKISTRGLPGWIVKAGSRFNPLMKLIANGLNFNTDVDGSDAPRVMGFEYISSPESVRSAAAFLVKNGEV